MGNDFTRRVHLNTVNISQEDYDAILAYNKGVAVKGAERTFDLHGSKVLPDLLVSDEIWDRFPENSIWMEDWFCWQEGIVHHDVRNKNEAIYSFDRACKEYNE